MFSEVLTKDQIKRIHDASLRVLERTGVEIPHDEILSRFCDLGADVDWDNKLVKLSPDLVMRFLNLAGKEFTLYGRDLCKKAEFGVGKRNYNTIAGEAHWADSLHHERRMASLDDVATATRFADALEYLTIPGAMADPYEIPVEYRCVEVMAAMLKNTAKPITFWFHDRASAKYIVEMMIALRGSTEKAAKFPICYPFLEPISPLRFPFNGIDLLFETSRLNLPVPIGPMAQMGLSAPAALAGTMAIENAEILAGICITQLIREGMPVCYGGICHAFDMRTTQMIFGGPEQAIFGVAMTQMGKSYGLPVYINVGLTDSKSSDAQAGLEAGITLAFGAAAGADIFGHMGICGVDQASSLDILVLQHEIISYIESMMRKVEFSDQNLGLDVIDKIGPGGSFIQTEHTVDHFRRELWFPKLLDREYFQAWLDGGAKNMQERCSELKNEILNAHEYEPLPRDLASEFDEIISAAKKDLKK